MYKVIVVFRRFFQTIRFEHDETTKYYPFKMDVLHLTIALKLDWRKHSTYTFPDPGYLGISIAIQIKSDGTKPNMVDTKLMGRISNKHKQCIL